MRLYQMREKGKVASYHCCYLFVNNPPIPLTFRQNKILYNSKAIGPGQEKGRDDHENDACTSVCRKKRYRPAEYCHHVGRHRLLASSYDPPWTRDSGSALLCFCSGGRRIHLPCPLPKPSQAGGGEPAFSGKDRRPAEKA